MTRKVDGDLVRLLRDAAIIVSRSGRIVAANSRMASVSGYTEQDLLKMRADALVIDGGAAKKQSWWNRDASCGVHEVILIRKDGARLSARLIAETLGAKGDSGNILAVFAETTGDSADSAVSLDGETILRMCLQNVGAAVLLIGSDGKVVFLNRKCCELAGCKEREAVGRNWASVFVVRRDRRRASENFEAIVSGKVQREEYYFEAAMLTSSGAERIMGWFNTTIKDSAGRIAGVLGSGLDITDYKRMTEALKDSERRYRLISENATDGVWTTDLSGNVTYISPAIAKISGFTSEEQIGKNMRQLVTPQSLEGGWGMVKRQLALEEQEGADYARSWMAEIELFCRDGSTVCVEARTTFIRDDSGHPVGLMGVTRNITERKRAEKILLESEKRYRTLFENSRDAICIMNRDGNILDVNHAALDLFGYSREESANLDLRDIASSRERRRFQQAIEKYGYVRDFGMRLRRKDGERLDCLLTFDLRRDDEGNIIGYEGSIRDITEYKRLQENLRLYVNEITRAQEDERLRLSRELHDGVLQNLFALKLNVEEAIRGNRRPLQLRVAHLEDIQNRVSLAAEELSRLSHALRPAILDQLGLVPAVRVILADLDRATGIDTSLVVPGEERRLDSGMELGLFRIIQEALNNVRKHSGAGSVEVKIEFASQSVTATVVDDGKGFEAPERIGDFAAMGKLGLIGMYERAQLFNGTFTVRSARNKGTTVRVRV